MRDLQKYAPVPINVPSPLAGEGSPTGRSKLSRVRGSLAVPPLWRRPLTRRRFAPAPLPTRGESDSRTRVA